ncbi:MAG: uracil-DNA glycosylase [Desulfobacterales bacterium]|jgi:DNA polymerase|nr:uracil-DNA glycosylase [Desulfobacterales bacterium]
MNGSGLYTLLGEIEHTLRYMAQTGCTGFDISADQMERLRGWGKGAPSETRETLSNVQKDLGVCRRCPLHRGRRHIVFGEGNPKARLVFVGEGPGFDEDQQGRPFVGAAGKLLTRIIEAMGLSREDVYICNIVKCRPPENRNPLPEEIAQCTPFLVRQLRAIQPAYICALGKVAAQFLSQSQRPISALRGRFFDYHGMSVMPTFHPAFLLRNPEKKREVWEDIQQVMRRLGLSVRGKKP